MDRENDTGEDPSTDGDGGDDYKEADEDAQSDDNSYMDCHGDDNGNDGDVA